MRRRGWPAHRRSLVAGAMAGALLGQFGGSGRAEDALSVEAVRIPVESGEVGGFRAMPARTGPFGCVVVVGDEAGVPDWVAAACRRLAGAGLLAIGVDAWGGAGEPPDEAVMRRLDAAFQLGRQHSGDPGGQGLVGFGRGGRATWLYAARSSALKAAASWGGALDLAVAGQLKAPVLGLYGQEDAANPRSLLLKAEAASGRRAQLVVYDGAAADFWAETRPTYDKAATTDGWDKMLAWFKHHGIV